MLLNSEVRAAGYNKLAAIHIMNHIVYARRERYIYREFGIRVIRCTYIRRADSGRIGLMGGSYAKGKAQAEVNYYTACCHLSLYTISRILTDVWNPSKGINIVSIRIRPLRVKF